MKLFMKIRHKMDQLSKEEINEITNALKSCSVQIEKIILKMENNSEVNKWE